MPEPPAVEAIGPRCRVQLGGQLGVRRLHLRRCGAQAVLGTRGDELREVREPVLETPPEPARGLDVRPAGTERAVEHDPVGAFREQGGVDRAEVGAVGDAEVGDLPLAQRLADPVHVARGVRGGDVGQHRCRRRGSAPPGGLRHPLGAFGDVGRGQRVLGDVRGQRGLLRLQAAGDRGAVPDPARVHADHVVGVLDARRQPVELQDGRVDQSGAAGPTGVGQQHAAALPRIRGGQPRDRDADLPTAGVPVVQGDLDRRALQARHGGVAGTSAPHQGVRRGARCRRRRRGAGRHHQGGEDG